VRRSRAKRVATIGISVGPVKLSELLEQPAHRSVKRVYGEAYETADGTTVIPVARIRASRRRRRVEPDADRNGHDPQGIEATDSGFVTEPFGIFVVHGGRVSWVPAVDGNRIALIGVTTGLFAALIGTLAVLRQPPWPRITITENR
jgi:hypothetical protein